MDKGKTPNDHRQHDGGRRNHGKRRKSNSNRRGGRSGQSGRDNGAAHPRVTGTEPLSPFALFCAMHLGITRENSYRAPKSAEVAQRFGLKQPDLDGKLAAYGLDRQTIRESGFELDLAKYDIRVAPEGVSRLELAKPWFDELRDKVEEIRPGLGAVLAGESVEEPAQEPTQEDEKPPVEVGPEAEASTLKSPVFDD